MKIYAIDDKGEEINKANEAIKNNGHEIGQVKKEYVMYSVRDFNKNTSDHSEAEFAQSEVESAVYQMKKVGGGIITDMMFHLTPPLNADDPKPPSGLLVVIQCLAIGVPVVVCTDADEVGGHHAQALHWIFDGYVMRARNKDALPFGWVENKDWNEAVKQLEQLQARKQEEQ